MSDKLKLIDDKRKKLDSYRPFPHALIKNLEDWLKIELTYTSNAIEGNTLSRQQTALVVEKGLTVAGKSLKEHLEAVNHVQALDFLKKLVSKKRNIITERIILTIHEIILKKIDDFNAGRYRNMTVRVAGSTVVFPNPAKLPDLMKNFIKWLHSPNKDHPVKIASDAHFKLVSIHPFIDGNGRTARLIMNLLLSQAGYPPALIRKEDRIKYIDRLEKGQLTGDLNDYYNLIYDAVILSLDIYLGAFEQKQTKTKFEKENQRLSLLTIGQLANKTGEPVSTIRFWTKAGLIKVSQYSAGGYQLYSSLTIGVVKKIRHLQKDKRLTINEIKQKI